jgi:hypothetical protein
MLQNKITRKDAYAYSYVLDLDLECGENLLIPSIMQTSSMLRKNNNIELFIDISFVCMIIIILINFVIICNAI